MTSIIGISHGERKRPMTPSALDFQVYATGQAMVQFLQFLFEGYQKHDIKFWVVSTLGSQVGIRGEIDGRFCPHIIISQLNIQI